MKFALKTDIGYVRDENQDRVEAREFGKNLLICICDGMGGERSGSKASSMAIDVFFQEFSEKYNSNLDDYGIRQLMTTSVSAANQVIHSAAKIDYKNFGMGTTCVAAYICDSYVAIVNVGDSRAYLFQNGKIEQLTRDHNVVNWLLDQGETFTEEEMKTHPQRHMLTRAVGVESSVKPDFYEIPRNEDEPFRLLLCTDGVCGVCESDEIESILSLPESAEELVEKIVAAALEKGGRDNISAAVVISPDVIPSKDIQADDIPESDCPTEGLTEENKNE